MNPRAPHEMLGRRARAFPAYNRAETTHEGVVVGLHEGPVLYMITESGAVEGWLASLTEEIEPGAGEVNVRRSDGAAHYITVENPEEYCALEHGPRGDVEAMTADPRLFPSPAWAVALDRVMENADSAMCDLADLTDEASGQMCSNAIGWVLHEDDEGRPMGSGMSWRSVTLVHTSEGIAAVCEDDAPDTLYGAAANYARRKREAEAVAATKARLARGESRGS